MSKTMLRKSPMRAFVEAGIPVKAVKAYRQHRQNAKKRGIPFLFTMEEWWAWWQVDERWNNRGNHPDDLAMCRIDDKGAYEPGNVYCATNRQNSGDIDPARIRATVLKKIARLNGTYHLCARGDAHPKSKAVITPLGRFGSAALAGEAHGYTRQHARVLASQNKRGWRWEASEPSPD